MDKRLLSNLPSIDIVLKDAEIKELGKSHGVDFMKKMVQEEIESTRNIILKTEEEISLNLEDIISRIKIRTAKRQETVLQSVVNGTGVVVHTNLGRSNLSPLIKDKLNDIAFGYSNLEYSLEEGSRGSRYQHLEKDLLELTGAEAVLVVNNNAAAVMLALHTFIQGKEIITSRGELVEIGGSFRIPDIIELSGGKIHEVGTTNKTHLKDYEAAINEETGAILKVHTSNYKVIGFSEAVPMNELVALGHKYNLPVMNDLGSGLLMDLSELGLSYEPTVKECIDAGCDIVTFSGDKLLGGPQAGIVVGKKKYIDQMKANQLTRALRVDKMTIAALESTIKLYLNPETVMENIPTLHMLSLTVEQIEEKAKMLIEELEKAKINAFFEIIDGFSQVGGGSYPGELLSTKMVKIKHNLIKTVKLEEELRLSKSHIITRVKEDCIQFDMRTINKEDIKKIIQELSLLENK